tara:strand:- start:2080 stop:2757 length:678 start_codon:yes stop_codon:yes gene_type:complete
MMQGFVRGTIKLDASFTSYFHKQIVEEISKKIKKYAGSVAGELTEKIQQVVRERLSMCEEYGSLVGGALRAQLGIPNAEVSVADIVNMWVQGIGVTIETGSGSLLTVRIGIIKDDYVDVLSLDGSEYTYIRKHPPEKAGQSQTIPWLQWLLLEGDRRIIVDYEFSPTKIGRSRMAGVMKKNSKKAWQVPSQYSGTSVDNFATRALTNVHIDIEKIVESTLTSLIE